MGMCIVLWKLCVVNTSPPVGSQVKDNMVLHGCKTRPKNEKFQHLPLLCLSAEKDEVIVLTLSCWLLWPARVLSFLTYFLSCSSHVEAEPEGFGQMVPACLLGTTLEPKSHQTPSVYQNNTNGLFGLSSDEEW